MVGQHTRNQSMFMPMLNDAAWSHFHFFSLSFALSKLDSFVSCALSIWCSRATVDSCYRLTCAHVKCVVYLCQWRRYDTYSSSSLCHFSVCIFSALAIRRTWNKTAETEINESAVLHQCRGQPWRRHIFPRYEITFPFAFHISCIRMNGINNFSRYSATDWWLLRTASTRTRY